MAFRQGDHDERQRSRPWFCTILGVVLVALGLVVGAGGIWLMVLGAPWYYLVAGAGLLVSGVLLAGGSMAGVWIYLVTHAFTLLWAFREVGTDWWAQVPRLVAPTVLLVLVLLCIPLLRPRRTDRTRDRARDHGRVATTAAVMVSVIAAGGMVIGGADRFRASAQEAPAAQEAPVARAAPAADQAPTQDAAPVLPPAAEENAAPPEDPGVQRVGTAGSEAPAGEAPITPPNIGGPIATAGGLVFIAATTDKLIRTLDIETGELLWRDTLPADGQATPMTFESSGRQFVVLAPGGHHFMEPPVGDHVIAWALPE